MFRNIIWGVLFALSLNVYGQDSTFLSGAINRLNNQPAQERVYLHLDKPNYGFGDTIWYKAYTVIGPKHQPSALSGVLYAELISPSDSLVLRQIIPLVSGIGWSDMPLPVNLKPGNYRLRAYTRWMRNFGADAFDEQRVMIGGIAPATIKSPEKYDVQFFPEGGELVDGVRSRVAIKAIGTNGFGKDIKGTIEDNTGNIVADFSTRHLGMGVFALTP
ncbi:MAG: Plug domain-containing protein, partial [Bacteroidetes bacterium]|nr:Plug domain-containing protein [Bacteroidota bacterium]